MTITTTDIKWAQAIGVDPGPMEPVPTVYQQVDRLRRDKDDLRSVNESLLAEIKECDAAKVKLQAAVNEITGQRDYLHRNVLILLSAVMFMAAGIVGYLISRWM